MTADKKLVARFGNPPRESLGGEGFSAFEADAVWRMMSRKVLQPSSDWDTHWRLFQEMMKYWPSEQYGPFTAWHPRVEEAQQSNIGQLMNDLEFDDYEDLYAWSVREPEAFWQKTLDRLGVRFERKPRKVLDLDQGVAYPKWLSGACMNIASSCFLANSDQPAIVWRKPGESGLNSMTYGQLDLYTNRVANSLKRAGFKPGDALAIDMIMNMESVVIYLGIVKAGCRVISIADSFTPEEIAVRLRIGQAAGIFTMDVIPRGPKRLPMYAKVTEANAPRAIVLPAGDALTVELREGDLSWDDFLCEDTVFETVVGDPHNIINILFSSGTTGEPKAIPWNHTTPIKGAMDGHFHHDIQPGNVVAWPTNLGWMMGPWLIFATLMNRGTIALYCDAPVGRGFCEFIQDAGVNMLGVVPSLVKAWRNANAMDGLDWSAIKLYSSTGECSNQQDMLYLMSRSGYRPVMEYCGGTEIGGGYLTGSIVQPASPAIFTTPTLGMKILLLDEDGNETDEGEVYIDGPSMGLSIELLNKDHYKTYFEGTPPGPEGRQLRRHGDQLERLPMGFYRAMGRADDTMNLGGIKTSSAELERALKTVEVIDETAAIAVNPSGGGPSLLVIYAVLKEGVQYEQEELTKAMQKALRTHLNPLFKIHDVCVVPQLPRTASGKVMRRVLRGRYNEA